MCGVGYVSVAGGTDTNGCQLSPRCVVGGENAQGLYAGHINGMTFTLRTTTRADALANCRLYAANNPGSVVHCLWQNEEIFSNR